MADIGSATIKINPVIDIPALEASVRSAIADALEQLAAEVRAEEPTSRWTIGQELTVIELEALPAGSVVKDADGDLARRLPDEQSGFQEGDDYFDGRQCYLRPEFDDYSGSLSTVAISAGLVASYGAVTLVSLP